MEFLNIGLRYQFRFELFVKCRESVASSFMLVICFGTSLKTGVKWQTNKKQQIDRRIVLIRSSKSTIIFKAEKKTVHSALTQTRKNADLHWIMKKLSRLNTTVWPLNTKSPQLWSPFRERPAPRRIVRLRCIIDHQLMKLCNSQDEEV